MRIWQGRGRLEEGWRESRGVWAWGVCKAGGWRVQFLIYGVGFALVTRNIKRPGSEVVNVLNFLSWGWGYFPRGG